MRPPVDEKRPTLIDNRGAPCAVGVIRLSRLLQGMEDGALVEVWSKDHFAPHEVPLRVSNDGHTLLEQDRVGVWPRRYWRFLIRRGS